MKRIYFGDNLPILRSLPDACVDLIYVDPPFNTRKTQKRTRIRTVRDEAGDRRGFQGKKYRTIELGTQSYQDSLDPEEYIRGFLQPRLVEAHRLLKPHGSLYFHVDYREVHYCKVLLDEIFGRESFLNEIIWAYDYGGRAKSRWPAKHDNILFYAKDPSHYVFNTGAIDREPYMAPGLVGPEKAEEGKLPTDVWWPGYLAASLTSDSSSWHLRGQNALWWQTIVPTNSRERVGYPTQKPRKLLDRIVKASSLPGGVVLDFFAGSGTTGESCLGLGRDFILMDNNRAALEVMAGRFGQVDGIEWVGFDPSPYRSAAPTARRKDHNEVSSLDPEFVRLAAAAAPQRLEFADDMSSWENSPFEWLIGFRAARKNRLGKIMLLEICRQKRIPLDPGSESSSAIAAGGHRLEVQLATLTKAGKYHFRQARSRDSDGLVLLGISPFAAHCWVVGAQAIDRNLPIRATRSSSTLVVDPQAPPDWLVPLGGSLKQALKILSDLARKKK